MRSNKIQPGLIVGLICFVLAIVCIVRFFVLSSS